MELEEFLTRVLPPTGTYFAAEQAGNKFNQHHTDDLDSLGKVITSIVQRDKAAYFATGSFKPNSVKRTTTNLDYKKALYLDLDCGPGKAFPTKKEAVTQLQRFCKAARMPAPNLVVDSGNGIHAYWTFDRPIPYKEWTSLADILKSMCSHYGLNADSAITADGARIMRAPGSVNKKDPANPKKCIILGRPKQDYPVDKLRVLLNAHRQQPAVPSLPDVDVSDLSHQTLKQHDWYAKYIFDECPTMRTIKDTGGAECSEPLWMQTLNLLTFCKDGSEYIHPVSNQHAGYNPRQTEQKFNLRIKAKNEERTGPTLCKTFAQYPQAQCALCPHNGEILSPISLGREPPPPPDEIPFPYKQDDKGIYLVLEDERVVVCNYQIVDFRLMIDPGGDYVVQCVFKVGDSQPLQFIGRVKSKTLFEELGRKGIYVHSHQEKATRDVMVTWAQQLHKAKQFQHLVPHFGWSGDDFIVGGVRYSTKGVKDAPITDNVIQDTYTPHGKFEKWKEAADIMSSTCEPEVLPLLASAFAAPLIKFSNIHGAVLSVVSKQSGTGKTSALKIAQAVWGNPIQGINSLDDTPNSIAHRMGTLHNLPLYWDELRARNDIKDFLSLIFRAGQGRDKARMSKHVAQLATGQWSTLITAASNQALKDYVDTHITTSDAGMQRIFEISMKHVKARRYQVMVSRTLNSVEENYGHAGIKYAKYLVENTEAIKKRLLTVEHILTSRVNANQQERFWISLIAALILGAELSNKLDLIQFDIAKMTKVLISNVTDMRRIAAASSNIDDKDNTALGIVHQFMHEHSAMTYITEEFPDSKGGAGQFIKLPDRFPAVVYIASKTGRVRLDRAAFRRWLKDNHHQQATILDELDTNYRLIQKRSYIAPKTDDAPALRTYLLELGIEEV